MSSSESLSSPEPPAGAVASNGGRPGRDRAGAWSAAIRSAAESGPDLDLVRLLFREYADGLGFDLCFQDFEQELAGLPGRYAEPFGVMLLAKCVPAAGGGERAGLGPAAGDRGDPFAPTGRGLDGRMVVAGCVALRPLDRDVCEMKRLYVREACRGAGLGRGLAEAVISAARDRGYGIMRLDTLSSMVAAETLYRALGFRPCPPYCHNPLPGARYYELGL